MNKMILKEELARIIELQKNEMEKTDAVIPREILERIELSLQHAIIISGIRRCGKSTLLRQLLKKSKYANYFNFEDPRAASFELSDFEKLDNLFNEASGAHHNYFFDEIQNIPEWERFVRSKLDAKKTFVITGSNASLLNKELGAKLTGRHLNYELFPFSFREFLKFREKKAGIESFEEYLINGGFPQFLQLKKIEVLQELFKDIIERDIVARYNLKESRSIQQLAVYLITNSGNEFSYNKLAKYLGLGSINTVIAYISYFEDSYLLFTVPRFSYSYKKQLIAPKKIYAIDTGMASANSASFSADKGRMLENLVFLHLRRSFKEIYYFREDGECDFILKERNKAVKAIQVCYSLNNENKERELAGLNEAMKKLKIEEGIILTFNQEDKIGNIEVVPVWKWMLDK